MPISKTSNVFFLGATGYLGSQFLVDLARELPDFTITALVRAAAEREKQLKVLYPNILIVEGVLEDDGIIEAEAAKSDIVVNAASSDHIGSIKAILAGLEKGSASRPSDPPLYLHVSGTGMLSDNVRGEYVEESRIKEWSDLGFDLATSVPDNKHVKEDRLIIAAGTRKENPIRTAIVCPAWIYGIGEGMQKVTLPVRIFLDMFQRNGGAGTWGPGLVKMNNIHVKDVSSALLVVLKAALEGKADEGAEGIYFAASMEPKVTNHDIAAKFGDIMHAKGLVPEGGSKPFPDSVTEALGEYGWSLFGGNFYTRPDRLTKFGWKAIESTKKTMLESLPSEIEEVLQTDERKRGYNPGQ
ncbi:NAD(P)-binding protein [Pleurotus eryngii]|uniref:NAD(P)-binding protein n=1 Tax=Pleurotus eryngii TaxID=5323 RepID=A0A9P5ZSN3_PLEER|nr:NAD(P)-binding protein [Pleurotus eryngii]